MNNKYIKNIIFFLLLAIFIYFRLTSYGNLGNSVGMLDTSSFIRSADTPIFSWGFMVERRPASMNFFYQILKPPSGYQLTLVSEPAKNGTTPDRIFQDGLDRIVVAQLILSILGWGYLAWVVYTNLNHIFSKILSTILILGFTFSPQLADWDSVLMSESLNFSIFALLTGLSIQLIVIFANYERFKSKNVNLAISAWLLVSIFWVFVKDTNIYVFPVAILVFLFPLLYKKYQNRFYMVRSLIVCAILFGLILFQFITLKQSQRWLPSFFTNLHVVINPYPDRVQFFNKIGMPDSSKINDFRVAPKEFMDWVIKNGQYSYARFLLDRPLWASLELFKSMEYLFSENTQPYFAGIKETRPIGYLPIGDLLHIKSSSTILIVLIILIFLLIKSFYYRQKNAFPWALFFLWYFISEGVILFLSFHGDYQSAIRHTLVAVIPFRLMVWLGIVVLLDLQANKFPDNQEYNN